MNPLAQLDRRHVWHPFTQMRDWMRTEPLVIVEGRGATLRDVKGREFLDANSSIWTNLHGHNHPRINAAIRRQLGKVAHTSALGLANEPASLLAARLVRAANPGRGTPRLARVFFSDDGSTAMEAALKLAFEFTRRTKGQERPRFLSLGGAYHGDTIGAASLGHVDLFRRDYGGLMFRTDEVMSPHCYRCPFNRARPDRADAREGRRCKWECVDKVEQKFSARKKMGGYAALIVEPGLQGAAGIIAQPAGWLARVAEIARGHGALLVADEVMTGFGRTGGGKHLFSCGREGVRPDLMALAKGMTGGYLPMAATLATEEIFNAFLGEYGEFKTFFHGHSFTGNQLGAAAALASLDLLESDASRRARARLEDDLRGALAGLWRLPQVGDIRQEGLVAGIELVRDWGTRGAFDLQEQAGIRVCAAMARRGVLTRPVGNVVVLMPPYCTTRAEVRRMVTAVEESVEEVLEGKGTV